MRKHSVYGPSGAERWMNCSASVRLTMLARERDMAYEVASVYAETGTYAMALLETAVKEGITVSEAFRRSNDPQPDGFGDEDLGALEVSRLRILEALDGADEWGAEEAVDIIPSLNVWGTCDFWARHGNQVTVIDYKHGAGVMVEAEGNKQLLLYALGFARRFPDADTFRLAICQPRGLGWTETTVTAADLSRFRADVIDSILFDTRAPRVGDWCRWCPALLVCPKRLEEAKTMADMDETALQDARNLRFLIEAGPRVVKLVEAAKAVAVRRLTAGAEIEGLELRPGPGRLSWREGAAEALAERYGEAAYDTQVKSPARVRDTLPGGADFVREWADKRPGFPVIRVVDTGASEE